ncbi:permease [Paenibacillus humicola]|uniref:permease n=1 Tax=Paenibacillus humicola TaxID=3110540 RepID=UPI00237AFDC8|nr:permease [Paenibacillus humicola]
MYRFGTPLAAAVSFALILLLLNRNGILELLYNSPALHRFKLLFIGVILEAFPFVLLGVFFSALLQVFVSDRTVARLTPKSPLVGVLFGCLLGLLLPICECGMIPLVRRLIRKGMPAYIGIVYIFAGPIINPVVFTSTYAAFPADPSVAYARMGLAFVVCALLGLLLYRYSKGNPLKSADAAAPHSHASAGQDSAGFHEHTHVHSKGGPLAHSHLHQHAHSHPHTHGHSHSHDHDYSGYGWRARIGATLAHASDEFFDIGKYLIVGSLIAAVMQTVLNQQVLAELSGRPVVSSAFMMVLAFALSLCSTSDAFVASSFSGIFGPGALLAFLVFGPMVDFKSTLMLLSTFKGKWVGAIIAFLFVAVLAGSIAFESLGLLSQ